MMPRLMLFLFVVVAGCRDDAPAAPGIPRVGCEALGESSCVCRPFGGTRYRATINDTGEHEGTGSRRSVYATRMLFDREESLAFSTHANIDTHANHTEFLFTELLGTLAQVEAGWQRGWVRAQAGIHDGLALTIKRGGQDISRVAVLHQEDGQPTSVLLTSALEVPQEGFKPSHAISETLEPLPLCRCDEVEDIIRDAEGVLTASRCRREGATKPRLKIDYGPRGLPLRIEEDRGDLPPVTVPRTLTSLPGPRVHPPVEARTRAIVMRWTADGWLEHVHAELDGRRYGLAVELGPTSFQLGWYFDDVPAGLWMETDADGHPMLAVDRGPTGGEARVVPIVEQASP